MKTICLFYFFLLCICSSLAQQGSWTELNTSISTPSARYCQSGVYVSLSNSMLIFGGQENSTTFFNDLWSYSISSNDWTELNPSTSPSVRCGNSAIYLPSSNFMLIFGGLASGGGKLNDLWSYDISSNSWTQLNPPNPPPPRYEHSGVYVSLSNSMLIFGGQENSTTFFNDLWSYDISSTSWTQLNPSNPPTGRYRHCGIYVVSSNSMLIFGGKNGTTFFNDLWSYDISSNTWTQLNPSNSPSGRTGHSGDYVSSSNSMLIFGGKNSNNGYLNDLWSYSISSNTWIQLTPSNPPPSRYRHSGIYDSSSNIMLIFAGENNDALDDLWSYSVPLQTTQQQTTSQQITSQQQTTSLQTSQQQSTQVQTTQQTQEISTTTEGSSIEITQIESKKNNVGTIIGIVLGVIFGVVCITITILLILIFMRRKRKNDSQYPFSQVELEPIKDIISSDLELIIDELIGKGNFGEVYKGRLGEFTVAVRKNKK